jgi:hypothetical protein
VLLENDTRGKVRLPALHIAAKKDDTKVKNNRLFYVLYKADPRLLIPSRPDL